MTDVTTKLFYGQQVYAALPKCACSDTVHDVSYTKLGAGYVRKYIPENDSYMVEITNNGNTSSAVSYCVCSSCSGVDEMASKPELKEIQRDHIFVLDLPDREHTYGEDMVVKTGDILNVYPKADKYKVVTFNSDFNLILVCSVSGIATNGRMDFSSMLIVDMDDPVTFISNGEGLPILPYTYSVEDGE